MLDIENSIRFSLLYFSWLFLRVSITNWKYRFICVFSYKTSLFLPYRISVIFTIGTQKRVRLPDQVLIQRFGLIMVICIAVLSAWTTSQPPSIGTIKLESGLKFYECYFGAWGYAALGGNVELLFVAVVYFVERTHWEFFFTVCLKVYYFIIGIVLYYKYITLYAVSNVFMP